MKPIALLRHTVFGNPGHHVKAHSAAHRTLRSPDGLWRWRHHAPRLSRFAVDHLLVLPAAALLALIWANTEPESYFRLTLPLRFLVNDVAMVFFFGLMMKEVVEATVVGGVLHPWRRALLPGIASVGAFVIPAVIYLGFVEAVDEPMLGRGWAIPGTIDIALAYFVARLIFGQQHPAVPFLLLLAIATDAIAFVVLALLYPIGDVDLIAAGVLVAAAVGLVKALRRSRVRSFWPYVLGGGGLSWYGLYWAGMHPALALIPIMPFLPHATRDPGFFVDAPPGARDALNRFELWWRYPVQGALFLFALVNAGVPLRAVEMGAWSVPVATLAGKPLGVLAAVGLAVAAGLHLPRGVGWRELTVIGLIGAIGFSIALFSATASMALGQLLSETKMGALLTVAAAPLALLVARVLRVGRFGR